MLTRKNEIYIMIKRPLGGQDLEFVFSNLMSSVIITDVGRVYIQIYGWKIEYCSKRHCFGQMNDVVNFCVCTSFWSMGRH
jgi:hypothetical protein